MNINIQSLKNSRLKLPVAVRQVMGALLGMLIAASLYFIVRSTVANRAVLVSPETPVTAHPGQIRVNDKTVDDNTLRRLQTQAATVARLQQGASSAASSAGRNPTPLERSVAARAQQMAQYQAATTPKVALTAPIDSGERERLRLASHSQDGNVRFGTQVADVSSSQSEQIAGTVRTVTVASSSAPSNAHAAATRPSGHLSDSGTGEMAVALLAFITCISYYAIGFIKKRA